MFIIPLVATSFCHFHHHQTKVTQNLKRLVTCSLHNFQVVCDPIYTNVKISNNLESCCW